MDDGRTTESEELEFWKQNSQLFFANLLFRNFALKSCFGGFFKFYFYSELFPRFFGIFAREYFFWGFFQIRLKVKKLFQKWAQ